jgi:hypothetical protein
MNLNRRKFVTASAAMGAGAIASSAAPVGAAEPVEGAAASKESGQLHKQSYIMAATLEATWHAYTTPEVRKIWWGYANDPLKDAKEVRPQSLIRSVLDHPGLPGIIETTETFETVPGGTRVTHSRTGFGEGLVWQNALETSSHGIDEMMGDFALYLRTGTGFPRHVIFRCSDLLKGTRQVAGGIEIFDVPTGSLAAQLGLKAGDTVVALGGAGIFAFGDVHFAVRTHKPGDEVEVVWVRDGHVLTGKGQMTWVNPLRGRDSTNGLAPPAAGKPQ